MFMDQNFEIFAKEICEYFMRNYFLPYIREHGIVQSYRARVISKDSSTHTMVIQRPFDGQIELPYANSASNLGAGDQCIVFSLGDPLNSVVVSDGKLNL